jgi:hypothetical protein
MLVAHDDALVRCALGEVLVTMEEKEFLRFEVIEEIEPVGVAGELAKMLVVISENELESAELAEAAEKIGEFAFQFNDRDTVVDDVAEDGEVGWLIEGTKVREALENIIIAANGH